MDNLEQLKNLNLLYVEDDKIIQESYSDIFSNFFSNIHIANNGVEALRIFENSKIDIIITDIKMPLMDGIELIKIIRTTNEKIPIIITSSYAEREFLLEAVKLKLVDFLIKPASYKTIKNALEESIKAFDPIAINTVKLSDDITYSILDNTLHMNNGEKITLQNMEAMLLELMIKYKNQIVTKQMIEHFIYKEGVMSEGGLKNLVFKLRKKIGQDLIETVKNVGYVLR